MRKQPSTSHTFSIGPMMAESIRAALVGCRRPWGVSPGRWIALSQGKTDFVTSLELEAVSNATNGNFIATILRGAP